MRAKATRQAPVLVRPRHLAPQLRPTAQGGLGGVPGHRPAEHAIVAGRDGNLDLQPPTMRTLGEVAQRAQTDHVLTQRGHTPLGAAHATAYVHARDPHHDGHQPPGAAYQSRPHASAAQAPRP